MPPLHQCLILPAAKDFEERLQVKSWYVVPLLASTITRRIDEITEDIGAQLLERINELLWHTIWADESTDVDNKATGFVFV